RKSKLPVEPEHAVEQVVRRAGFPNSLHATERTTQVYASEQVRMENLVRILTVNHVPALEALRERQPRLTDVARELAKRQRCRLGVHPVCDRFSESALQCSGEATV